MAPTLTTNDHRADSAGLKYVYPVLSRRAGGLSIGINFNTNNTCNWRCVYCQVPGLVLGQAPAMDFALLEQELRGFLAHVLDGGFFQRFQTPAHQRAIKDIAIAGNGEPTSLAEFPEAVALVGRVATELGVLPASRYVLITNGSLVHRQQVRRGLELLRGHGGEVWFKFDCADDEQRRRLNHSAQTTESAIRNLELSARHCPTIIQTCVFSYRGQIWTCGQRQAYLRALAQVKAQTPVSQVMLYTLARPSAQPEAAELGQCPPEFLTALADEVRALGYQVQVSC